MHPSRSTGLPKHEGSGRSPSMSRGLSHKYMSLTEEEMTFCAEHYTVDKIGKSTEHAAWRLPMAKTVCTSQKSRRNQDNGRAFCAS